MVNKNLSLDKRIAYQIKIPGDVIQFQIGAENEMGAFLEKGPDGQIITTFTCTFDQAGLHGFLQSLYAKGIPLISMICIDDI
jgi:hypothetical protein